MRKIKSFFAVVALLLAATAAFAQSTVKVYGAVTEASGEAVLGAAVQLQGSSTVYAMTDATGSFTLSVPDNGTLVISCLGFKTAEVAVSGRSFIDVILEPDQELLDEVFVVAYGSVRKEANTGSVTSLKTDKLVEAPATSIDKMLGGKIAGVQMSSYSGQPGSTTSIRVRGTSSVNAGNEPLWVVDGIPIIADDNRQFANYGVGSGTNTAFLNPNDIESITVLKDAAAASVYGSRAANGVILVTTKSGKAGQAKFTARAKYGAQQIANDRNLRPMTGKELIDYWRVAAVNGGFNPDDPTSDYYIPMSLLENGTHNWYKDLTRIGSLQEYEIDATGGNDKGTYYSSLSYHKNDGVYYGEDYNRFSARLNADYKLTDNLTSGARVNVSYNNSDSGPMGAAYYINPAHAMFSLLPWTPMFNEDGSYSKPDENSGYNPMANGIYDENNDKEYRFNGNMFLEWKPINGLSFKTVNGAEASFIDSRTYSSDKADPEGATSLETIASKELRYTTSNTVAYQNLFGDHSLRVLLGQEAMIDKYDGVGVYSPNVDPEIPYPTTGLTSTDQGVFAMSEYSLLSFLGVADYNYNNKYFFQGSVRADGSSLFGSENKWGLFWSVSGSWNIASEKFMASTDSWLNELKLRASYGVNGNNNISPYQAYGVYGTMEYNGVTGMKPRTPDNPNLSWEKNKTWNVGLDFGFLNNRISGSIDVYNRLTTDMLLDKQVPYTTGFGSNFMNTGSLRNRGVEFSLDADIIRAEDWGWTAGFNIALNRSKVLDLAGSEFLEVTDPRAAGSGDDGTAVRIVEGMSLYNFYIREYAGVNPSTGEGLFVTEDGTLTSDRTKGHYIYAGSPEPKATGGFNTEFYWKGLSLSAFFEYCYGNKVLVGNWFITDGEDTLAGNSQNSSLNYWKKPGDTGCTPIPIAGGSNVWYAGYSTRFLEDGSYLRLKDITISYNLPEKITRAAKLDGVKFYVSALNPYTWHHVHALDPEYGPIGCAYGGNHTMVKSVIAGVEIAFGSSVFTNAKQTSGTSRSTVSAAAAAAAIAAANAENEKLAQELAALKKVNSEKDEALRSALAEKEAAEKELAAAKAAAAKAVNASESDVDYIEMIRFGIGEAGVSEVMKIKIEQIVKMLNQDPEAKVVITGHADHATGSADVNNRLSGQRAKAVAEAIQAAGIAADRISYTSDGAEYSTSGSPEENRVAVCVVK